jgi:hypothetical protein
MMKESFISRPNFSSKRRPFGLMSLLKTLEQVKEIAPEKNLFWREKNSYILFKDYVFARTKTRFRPVGVLDWANYTEATLREAILNDSIDEYYKTMLGDDRSPNNVWEDKNKEVALKTYYADRKEYYS